MSDTRQRFIFRDVPVPAIHDTRDNHVVCYMYPKLRADTRRTMALVMAEALNREALRREQAARPAPAQGSLPTGATPCGGGE